MSKKEQPAKTAEHLYDDIRKVIEQARSKAYRAVNQAMVKAYWHIGRLIVEEEQKGEERAEYGKELIKQLAEKLTGEYGKGFTPTNLKYMRQFYNTFEKSHAVRGQLSWTHYRLLLKVEEEEARDFYLKEAVENNWSTRTLNRQIGNLYYQRMLMSKDKSPVRQESSEKQESFKAKDIIKDPYVLDFLELEDNTHFRESELEQAIIDKLQDFLLELGKGFAFVDRQYRLTAGPENHFYADLVFYNYILKCFLVIDLKTKPLKHQDIGQMDMYVRYFEDKVRQENDNPTIGLILCTEKNNTIVKYSVLNESKQLFASEYKTYMPSEKQLKEELERERELAEQERRLKKKK
ncbi:PDDEXK nuclease domain-containing protein [Salibacter halophilus]|uniref:DUF1016 domain-containing protein n=1 Tax=Salibacter halophilus TaxID=1803916 RepID=A0A6N6M151_9FLAO|nr:PDDEXK nuclease domain-containing protein [Salibacter halophilus]KAB1061467.1 DUF1016 domain-containing protein [Salibacter halophilus]